jgi:hypothetical protein
MTDFLRSTRSLAATIEACSRQFKGLFAALLLLIPCMAASAQTTTIGGTVFDPRTTANALPLPNVLVYVTTGAVTPLASGVQCLTYTAPTGVASYTYTAVDGTFTLTGVPENTAYTLVIQAGKWRRQFSETVAAAPLAGLVLHMPADHTQGDIPFIAIDTGRVDGVECVLHDMGIADSEFTDDNGTTNAGGRIHLYKASGNPGAEINASTPTDTALLSNTATLNGYDMVMFPCQGSPFVQSNTALTNVLNYANAGGRVFTTHYSYVWLDPDAPFNSQFPPVADWDPLQADPTPDPGIATVNTAFTDGGNLAQWLQNAGVSYQNKEGQVQIGTLRHDTDGVIPPTQSWLTLNNTGAGNPVMQFTFNTPVAAPAASQCGRVLFNEYHVINGSFAGMAYPSECPATTTMSAQEEMLEYALFDLSAFVQPVVVPTLSIAFTPSPLIVKQNDSGDQVTVNVTNTSATTAIDSSATLTFVVPSLVSVTAMTDSTGGWNCKVSTLTCTRTTIIGGGASDSVTLALSVGSYPAGGLKSNTGLLTATVSSATFSNNVTASDTVVFQQPPPIVWATPAPIVYGTALSGAQLDATSTLPGSFSYNPAAGTVLTVGQHALETAFTPADTVNYTGATASVILTVLPATPVVSVSASANPAFVSNAVTFTALFSSIVSPPTGTVTFLDGTRPLGSSAVSAGIATFTTSALTFGTHSITADYSGDGTYQPAASGALTETIADFTLTVLNGAETVYPTGQAVYSLVLTPSGSATLAGAVSLTVSGIPPGGTAVFSPATVAQGSGASQVTLQVNALSASGGRPAGNPFRKSSLPVALGLVLLPFAGRWRKMRSRLSRLVVFALTGAVLAVGLTGCGTITLTPQNYSVTITATSGSLSHQATVKLTVE